MSKVKRWNYDELLHWLKTTKFQRVTNCPNHGFNVPNSLVSNTCYCKVCNKIWIFRRNTYNWKYIWYYVNKDTYNKRIEKINEEIGVNNGQHD